MGPKLFSFKKGETTYSLRLLPIGGYCAMEGEDEDSENPRAFNNAKIWKRMIIIVAGAFMNILFGLALMFFTLMPNEQFASTTVSDFTPYAYTASTGLQKGDKIVRMNGYKINTSMDFSYAMYTMPLEEVDGKSLPVYKQDCSGELLEYYKSLAKDATDKQIDTLNEYWFEGGNKIINSKDKEQAYAILCEYIDKAYAYFDKEIDVDYPVITEKSIRQRFVSDLVVVRGGKEITLTDVQFLTYKADKDAKPTINPDFTLAPIDKNFGTLLSQTFSQTVSVVRTIWNSLIGMVTGQFGLNEVAGPVGLAKTITDVAGENLKESFMDAVMSIVYIMMVISVNLGIVNMLPFPALDGGRFVLLLIEAIFKKPVPRKVEGIINGVGLMLLLGLMAVITFKDVWMLIIGG